MSDFHHLEYNQALGPHRPQARVLAALLDTLGHLEVASISINGQTGIVIIETYHEGLTQQRAFDLSEWEEHDER